MIECSCNNITTKDLVQNGVESVKQYMKNNKIKPDCGSCIRNHPLKCGGKLEEEK